MQKKIEHGVKDTRDKRDVIRDHIDDHVKNKERDIYDHNIYHRIHLPFPFKGLHQRNEKEEKILADIKEKVEPVIEKIRPMLQADGGDIELVDVENDGTVKEVFDVKVVESV